MSASTSPTPSRFRSSRKAASPVWWCVSLFLHLCAFVAIVTLTPLKDVIIPPQKSLEQAEENRIESMQGDKVETAAEQILEVRTSDVRLNVEELTRIRDEMAQIEKIKEEEFEKATGKPMDTPPPMDETALARLKIEADAKRKEIEALEKKTGAAEEEAARLAKEAEAKSDDLSKSVSREKQLADEISKLRKEANEKRKEANSWEGKRQNAEREANHFEAEKNQKENLVKQLDAQAKSSRKKEADANLDLEKVKKIAEEKKTASKQKREEQKTAMASKKVAETEAVRLDNEANKLEQELQALRNLKNNLENEARRLEQVAEQKRNEADDIGERARGLETQVRNLASRLSREQKLKSGTTEQNEDLAKKDIVDLYDTARNREDEIAEIYRNIRAAQLAMIRNMSFSEALKNTDVAKTPRPDIDRTALVTPIRDGKNFIKYEKELTKVSQELDSMLSLASNMKGAAQGLTEDGKEGMNISGDWAKEMAGALGKLEGQAGASKERGDVKDMTGLMENAYATADSASKKGAAGAEGASQGQAAGAGGQKGGGGADAGKAADGAAKKTAEAAAKQAPVASEPWKLMHKEGGGGTPRLYKPNDSVKLTRIISSDGEGTDWLFLDSWYVIGPFPNPERKNINKLFPPETVVDLDASYEGVNGQMVRWVFMQVGSPLITPPRPKEYTIYYFYTELRSDEARDIWLLIGSDDQSKLWINGQLIWKSADILKGWNIDEGYRRVRLSKGVNKVLVRLENGWKSCGVSLGFLTRPAL